MKSRSQVLEERRQRRIRVGVSVFLVFLMVFSTVGFYFTASGTSERYNGVKLRTVANAQGLVQGYNANIDGKDVFFYTHPLDSLSIPVPDGFAAALRTSQGIVWVFDPQDNATAVFDQLRYDFSKALSSQQGAGVTRQGDGAYSAFPIVSCSDAAPGFVFVMLESGERNVTYEDGCFVVSGGDYDWPLLRDRILYLSYGITES
jgi:hypothetical protein